MHKTMIVLTWLALWVLALGSLTSMSLLAGVHIFLALPCLYFVFKARDKSMSWSMWGLLAWTLIAILSVVVNWSIIPEPWDHLDKTKYFVIGLLSVFAFRELVNSDFMTENKAKWIWRMFLFAVTLATVCGLIGLWTGFTPIRMKPACSDERACGLFGMLMTYAYSLSGMMVLIAGVAVYGQRIHHWVSRPWLWAIFAINAVGLYFSYTRGAWIGLFVGIPFLFFKDNKKAFIGISASAVLLAGLIFAAVPEVRETFMNRAGSDGKRIAFYQAAYESFKEKSVLGLGYRNFGNHVLDIKARHDYIAYPKFSGHAHSNYFEALASTGLLGLIAYLVFFGAWIWECYKRDDFLGRSVFAYLMSFSVAGLFQFTFGDGAITFFLFGLFALTHSLQVRRSFSEE